MYMAEPPVLLFHNDAQSLREVVANFSSMNSITSIRLSLVCAAYGEPDYPIITWSSPINGVEDYATLAVNDDSINVFNDQQLLPNTQLPVTVSILELCDFRPENLTEYMCVASNSNSPLQGVNLSTAEPPLGAFAVMYSFASGGTVALSYYEVVCIVDVSLTLPPLSFSFSLALSPISFSLSIGIPLKLFTHTKFLRSRLPLVRRNHLPPQLSLRAMAQQ